MTSTTTTKPNLLFSLETNTDAPFFYTEKIYYRSKLFTTDLGINPLIAAASPIFYLAGSLIEKTSLEDENTEKLFTDLQHEIKAFENSAKAQHYRTETILVTRYLLCTFLDEIIFHKKMSAEENTDHTYSLLLFFHQEQEGSEKFYFILEKLLQDPELHIDMIELIYLCLALGFQGKYRHHPNAREIGEKLMQELFECIREQRGDLKKELQVSSEEELKPPVMQTYLPFWLIISFTLAVLVTIYSSFSYMLGNNAETLYQTLNTLTINLDA